MAKRYVLVNREKVLKTLLKSLEVKSKTKKSSRKKSK